MKLTIDSQIYGFTFLMYGQMIFAHMFDNKENAEWGRIQPCLKKIHSELNRSNKDLGYKRAVEYNGMSPITYDGFHDLYYVFYCMSNYRVPEIRIGPNAQLDQENRIMHMVLCNVCRKSHKDYNRWISRFI